MRLTFPIAVALLALGAVTLPAADVLRTAADLDAFARGEFGSTTHFAITGVVQQVFSKSFTVQDASGRVVIQGGMSRFDPHPGEEAVLLGHAKISPRGEPWTTADSYDVIGYKPVTPPAHVALPDLDEIGHNLAVVIVEGTVIRAFNDEIDDNYQFLLLKDDDAILPVALRRDAGIATDGLVNSEVRVRGTYHRTVNGFRRFCGPFLDVPDATLLTVVQPAPADPFDAPPLEARRYLTPREVSRLGRRTVRGLVAAVWRGNRLMLREDSGRIVNVELADGVPPPECGTWGMAVGYPETDLFRLNLSNAQFKEMPDGAHDDGEDDVLDVTPNQIRADKTFRHEADLYHGKLVRLTGLVRSVPSDARADTRMILDCGGQRASVDLSANQLADGLPLGSKVEVTGRCLLETENRHADNVFPRIQDFAVIPRSAADVRILALPPWWTPGRLLAVIGVLAALFVAVFVWNETLRRQVRRRSRELTKSRLTNMKADIRISERNRLAVELHDTISQNIAGASMRLDAAGAFFARDPPKALVCLNDASRTLVSCREELRNFIWDLRNRILDEPDVAEAVRKTVQPHLNKEHLAVRFDVPRARLTDNTLHAILCCIRELVSNAIRHGRADAIGIAGARNGDRIGFSVTDNGCGFDPDDRPGVAQGHFGLQGVGERVRALGGEMKIESETGKGTKVTIWVKSLS